ncbi:RNA polymerase sigma-70 factor [Pseudoflavitalea sp. X16]|uniref:RNA polymerase sigma-70 factor n=1 Tax=Paraflavitalea devenefica TaxID=2716334 RepID=UPI001422CB33|nr:RNA polymerase sigma-70 factor [Paraflavitalea devenefica]NII23972.1 RNA polymerase sigma-70 factor [Paraflavitalea devenefica]
MAGYDCMQDTELAALIKSSDEHAFAALYNRYFSVLYLHAFHRLKDKDEAKDLVQDLFLRLWTQREDLPSGINFTAYLYAAVRNRVLNILAHKCVENKFLLTFQESTTTEAITDHLVREHQLAAIIEKQVRLLPPKMRQVFELSRKSYMTHHEIAERLDLSEQSVRSHVKGALRLLRAKLGIWLYTGVLMATLWYLASR